MNAPIPRASLRDLIDTVERLDDVLRAQEDLRGAELNSGETLTAEVRASDGAVFALCGFPQELFAIALRAIERELRIQLETQGVNVESTR